MSQSSTNKNQTTNDLKKNPEIYLPPNKTGKRTLVLDLDETLVHSQFGPFDVPSDVVIKIEIENEIHDIHVLVRPGVKEFLEKLSKRFEIIIFTASISKYAGPLLDILDKNKYCSYRLFREHCTIINTSFVKDLKKLGRDLKDVIIVDNSPIAYLLNNDNGLPILTWFEDKNDRELYKICPVLEFLSLVPDVRDYIPRIVVNNEISYNLAMNVINEYNEMLNKKQNNENNENEKDSNIIENNNELSDSSENNLVIINKDKKQQININIINNNITNYILDNNKKLEEKEKSNDNYIENKDEKNKFNPSNIIANVNKPINNNPSKEKSLSHPVEPKSMNKGKISNSMKNIGNKKEKLNKNNLNIKIGQNNIKYCHKKSQSTGINHINMNINKSKNNIGDILNSNTNNFINNKNKNNLSKSSTFRNHTNYITKSSNNNEDKINNKNSKKNIITKSAKCLNHDKQSLRKSNNNNSNQNIIVHKKYNFSNNKYEKGQIRLYHNENEGSMTTVHKKQNSLIYFNVLHDKTNRNNNTKKSQKDNSNKLIHSVDFSKSEVATYYHNNNFPLFKKSSNNSNANSGEITHKNKNKNNFLKSVKLVNKKYNNSSSIESMKNKINLYKNYKNKISSNINNNKIDKHFFINHTLQEKNFENNEEIKIDESNKNNNEQNINNNPNLDSNLNLTHSYKLNSKSESMKNLFDSEDEKHKFSENDKIVNVKKKKNNYNSKCNSAKRPKSSNIFKYPKENHVKKRKLIGISGIYDIKRNPSDKNKYVKTLRCDINEILERRGIVKSVRLDGLKGEFKYSFNSNFTANNSKSNSTYKNKNKLNNIAKEELYYEKEYFKELYYDNHGNDYSCWDNGSPIYSTSNNLRWEN